jgi:hypothetical protein
MTKYEIWPEDMSTPVTGLAFAFRFTGNMVESYTTGRPSGKGTYATQTNPIAITFTNICPAAGSFQKAYTATATEFIWFETGGTTANPKKQLWTFTKQ